MISQSTKTIILKSTQYLIAFLFIISAIAKLYPSPYFAISTFEAKELLPMGFSQNVASYFSRTLIGGELALGILLCQQNILKKVIIPASFLLLLIFSIHLSIDIISSGNQGNCGCFGSLLPMTPLQALIKNILAMGILIYLFKWIFDRLFCGVISCILTLIVTFTTHMLLLSNILVIKRYG